MRLFTCFADSPPVRLKRLLRDPLQVEDCSKTTRASLARNPLNAASFSRYDALTILDYKLPRTSTHIFRASRITPSFIHTRDTYHQWRDPPTPDSVATSQKLLCQAASWPKSIDSAHSKCSKVRNSYGVFLSQGWRIWLCRTLNPPFEVGSAG